MKKYFRDYLFLFLVAGAVVILDQWTKHQVRTSLPLGETWSPWPWLESYARIVHWKNTGAAFGMFQGMSNLFAILAVVVSGAIIYFYPQVPRTDWPIRLALGLQLGGALGNLIDRLAQEGHVTDFISLGSFPVFNVADASISIGVAILILSMWVKERGPKEPPAESSQEKLPGPTMEEVPGREDEISNLREFR